MYPKYKYHAEKSPILVSSEEQEEKLGDDWKDSPADHGLITQPSVEQQFDIDAEEDKKKKELSDTVEDAVDKKRGPGRPKKNEEE